MLRSQPNSADSMGNNHTAQCKQSQASRVTLQDTNNGAKDLTHRHTDAGSAPDEGNKTQPDTTCKTSVQGQTTDAPKQTFGVFRGWRVMKNMITANLAGVTMLVKVDTGSDVDVMPLSLLQKLPLWARRAYKPYTTPRNEITCADGDKVSILGTIRVPFAIQNVWGYHTFKVLPKTESECCYIGPYLQKKGATIACGNNEITFRPSCTITLSENLIMEPDS